MTTFGVDFSAHVQENHTQIPHLVRQCVAKIDEEGIELKVGKDLVRKYTATVCISDLRTTCYSRSMQHMSTEVG